MSKLDESPVADSQHVVRAELESVVQGPAFRTSRRSREFLQHIVEISLNGQYLDLKERVIGTTLFGRPADYDTNTDAIVRVTANDTRKRLALHYSNLHELPPVQIELPAGSYQPAFRMADLEIPAPLPPEALAAPRPRRQWIWPAIALTAIAACVFLGLQNQALRSGPAPKPLPAIPWGPMVEKGNALHIVLADASTGGVQVLAERQLALSEYASGNYIPESLAPELNRFAHFLLRNQYTTAAYALSAVRLSDTARTYGAPVNVVYARSLSTRFFKGGGSFILLGTPRSNPWVQLFDRDLNFVVQYTASRIEPKFVNRRPRPGEVDEYLPRRSPTGDSGDSYGSIAFLPNRSPNSHVLIIAGTSSQAVEAASDLVTDLPRFETTLRSIGMKSAHDAASFELLFRVTHSAGVPMRQDLIAHRWQ